MKILERQIVSALIFSNDNKLFMGKKDPSKGGVYSDCWHLPGGGIEDGEDKLNALIREVKEETGIDIHSNNIKLVSDNRFGRSEKLLANGEKIEVNMEFNVYRIEMELNSAEIQVILHDDLVEYRWFLLDELNEVKLTHPSIELFQRLHLI